MTVGKHEKDKNDTAPAARHVGFDYDKTGGGKHRPRADLTGGHAGSRHDGDGKSSPTGWGGDRSARE